MDQKQQNESMNQKQDEKQDENDEHNNNEKFDTAKTVFNGIGTITEIFKPFVPYIEIILNAANAIIKIYEDAKYNKNICLVFVERMRIAKFIIERLTTSKESNIEKFQEQSFLDSLVKFSNIVRSIKKFVLDISQMNQRKRFFNAAEIRENIDKLRQDFNESMNDLQFSIIANQMIDKIEENKKIEKDLNTMQQYLEKILDCVETTAEHVQKIALANEVLNNDSKSNIWNTFKAPQIDPKEITDPRSGASHGKVKKKVYLAMDVACKPFEILNNESPQFHKQQGRLTILNELQRCRYIIKFHGISNVDGQTVLVYDWAEKRNLKEYYSTKPLIWKSKLQIARDICHGLNFLCYVGVLHHDVRCENILLTDRLEPKITNFELCRKTGQETTYIDNPIEMFPWMAPEKMKGEPYTHKCEVFSFGMLLWELAYQKVPYEKIHPKQSIRNYVIEGDREVFEYKPGALCIPKAFTQIIADAWQGNPINRPNFQVLLEGLDKLCKKYDSTHANDSAFETVSEECNYLGSEGSINSTVRPVIPFEEGVRAHKEHNRQKAWECFRKHADLDNPTAIYWKGYYYLEGYVVEKNQELANKLFKIAADKGDARAQVRYALSLTNDLADFRVNKEKRDEFIKYLTMAVNSDDSAAMWHLGDTYYNGKLNFEKDKAKGIEYIRDAALRNFSRAVEFVKKFNIDLLQNESNN
ncbi:kinase-like protein [Gigaspora margarita]|uniref:Kinase-like protein n=1 Tax=Gigaspora margarita TaxID=4874 RepID=A0A8H4ASK9_GIGMA|nr:kinase-like protein [Gigaspora margarita]